MDTGSSKISGEGPGGGRIYALLRTAVNEKKQVTALYGGLLRKFCPHALGMKRGDPHCWAFQFGGESSSGPVGPKDKSWRCFRVNGLSQVAVRDGEWFTRADRYGQKCVDEVDVEASG